MARTSSRSQIRTRIQRRLDEEGGELFTTAEWNDEINEAFARFHGWLVSMWGHDYFRIHGVGSLGTGVQTVAGTAVYALPANCMFVKSVAVVFGASQVQELRPFAEHERARTINRAESWGYGADIRYRLHGTATQGQSHQITFIPTPTGVYNVDLIYVPNAQKFTDDGDTIESVDGWDEWLVLDVCRRAALKQSDHELVAVYANEQTETAKQILALGPHHEAGWLNRIVDTEGWFDPPPWYPLALP